MPIHPTSVLSWIVNSERTCELLANIRVVGSWCIILNSIKPPQLQYLPAALFSQFLSFLSNKVFIRFNYFCLPFHTLVSFTWVHKMMEIGSLDILSVNLKRIPHHLCSWCYDWKYCVIPLSKMAIKYIMSVFYSAGYCRYPFHSF